MNLADTIDKLQESQYLKRDIIVSARGINMNDLGLFNIEDKESILNYSYNKNARRQICEITDMPVRYFDKLQKDHKELLCNSVNTLLHYENKNYLVRTVLNEYRNEIRAVLSDRYKIINNLDVLEAVNSVLKDVEYSADIDIDEDYLYCAITFDSNVITIGELQGSPSLLVVNSEIGDGAFKIIPRVTIDENISFSINNVAIRKAHLGNAKTKGVVSDELCEDLKNQITNSIDNYINSELFIEDSQELESRLFRNIADIFKSFEKVIKDLSFNEDEKKLAVVNFLQTKKSTAFDIIKSVLKVSNKFSTKRREEIENKIFTITNKLK